MPRVKKQNKAKRESRKLPAWPLDGITSLPGMVIHFEVGDGTILREFEEALYKNSEIFLVTRKSQDESEISVSAMYSVGTVAKIIQISHVEDSGFRIMAEAKERAILNDIADIPQEGIFAEVIVPELPLNLGPDDCDDYLIRNRAMIAELKDIFLAFCQYYPRVGQSILKEIDSYADLSFLMDKIAVQIPFDYEKQQMILEAMDLRERFDILTGLAVRETDMARIRAEIASDIKEKIDSNQRNYVLREHMAFLREELEGGEDESEERELLERCERLEASEEVKQKIKTSIRRWKNSGYYGQEATVERNYFETLLDMPWNKTKKENDDLNHAMRVLDRDHYGLEKVKERVLEFLAVRKLNGKGETPILCLVGPPGTGKTSIVQSVAAALELNYVRVCLGGVRDEAEIRGHRKTYVGAMAGRIVKGLIQAECNNPVMLLDEIDKVGSSYKGDISAALLELLDPEQNSRFSDHYVEMPLDLSRVLFIATANSIDSIPKPLLDRMEVVEIPGYTTLEKFQISKKHLLSKVCKSNGIERNRLKITDGALRDIISLYTRESGVRGLQRQMDRICRKAAWKIVTSDVKTGEIIRVDRDNLKDYLGQPKYLRDTKNKKALVGVVRGLAWTSVGGVTMEVEVGCVPGKGQLSLTGQLGDVMKESARAAMTYARSRGNDLHIKKEFFEKNDFHIHFPEGAVPKDGPSAGITMATALISCATGIPVHSDVAMTGEITLRGQVLPIGGLREKLLAAGTAGIKTVLIPEKNSSDLEEIPSEIKDKLQIIPVSDMMQVLEVSLKKRKSSGKGGIIHEN